MTELKNWIEEALRRAEPLPECVKVDLEQKKQLLEAYFEALIETNQKFNLTAKDRPEDIGVLHLLDSLSLFRLWQELKPLPKQYLDLGTGAGLPGMVMKIILPELDVVLLDALKKRLRFLDEVQADLRIEGLSTVHARFEDAGHDQRFRENFSLVTARAVAKLPQLLEYAAPFVVPGGYFVAMKGDQGEAELATAKRAMKLLHMVVLKVDSFTLPGTDIKRSLILFQKARRLDKVYPRRPKEIQNQPL